MDSINLSHQTIKPQCSDGLRPNKQNPTQVMRFICFHFGHASTCAHIPKKKKKEATMSTDFSFMDKICIRNIFFFTKIQLPGNPEKKKLQYSSLKIQKPIIENFNRLILTFFQISIQHLTSLTEMKCSFPSV